MTLYQEILAELAELNVDDRTLDLVMASLEGGEAVERVLEGGSAGNAADEAKGGEEDASSVYLHDINVSGFRGIGPEVKLELPPGPGLTVVVGRNGSGKSSFAEALEVLLTGDTLRWADRAGPWKGGWRNLHHPSSPRVTARFQVEGKRGLTTVNRAWSADGQLPDSVTTAQHHGEKRTDLAGVGWQGPLDLYRPLLSYNELGMIGAGPSALFDTLSAVLGLEVLPEAAKALATARLERTRLHKEVNRERLDRLLPALEALEDGRARTAVRALRKRTWDIDTIAGLGTMPDPEQDSLHELAALEAPDDVDVIRVAEHVECAIGEVSRLAGTDTERAQSLVEILQGALEHHRRHGEEPCPVCGLGTLDGAWRRSAESQIEELTESARRYRSALRSLTQALDMVASLVEMPEIPSVAGIDTMGLSVAWALWAAIPDRHEEVPDHLVYSYPLVAREAERISEVARSRFSAKEKNWSALLPDLMGWVPGAREALAQKEVVKQITVAEQALKQVTATLRSARWAPIETKALGLWRALRLQSNVDLRSVELAGSRTQRRVDLKVEVDGVEAQALAVASQGEIGCLALSLFFPRATLPSNPFRFLVIDDPIQSMDPARVDGLARVFDEVAADRQLVVFTHDDRLPESLRRLRIEHTCKQVTRRPGSVVEVREKRDPVIQYFMDARSVALDSDLPQQVATRVVPGMCREGLEAACVEAVRRRRLGKGEPHSAVDDLLERTRTLKQKTSLALFDDPGRAGGDISRRITGKWGRQFADAFWDANRGAHKPFGGSLKGLINDCQGLAERLRRL